MSTDFVVSAKNNPNKYQDNVSEGDAVTYKVDFRPWQADNSAITSVTWTVESGSVAISGQSLTSGLASALLTFTDAGKSIVSVLATTATEKKKIWLDIVARDLERVSDDYGICS